MCTPMIPGSGSEHTKTVDTCAAIYDSDADFGPVAVVNPPDPNETEQLPPSKRIDQSKLAHLSEGQRNELLTLLHQFQDCFSDVPGFCDLVEHEIPVNADLISDPRDFVHLRSQSV